MRAISRRDILKTLAMGAVGGSVLQMIPAQAAEFAHAMVNKEKKASPTGSYTPKYFSPREYKTLQALCDAIIPKDENSAGALEAGAPEFIDLLTSENKDYQLDLGGGLLWLNGFCADRFGAPYLECKPEQQKEALDLVAYRKNAKQDASLTQGIAFFAFLRKLTCDGYFTSEIGIKDLHYMGNTFVKEFPGCPPLPEA